VATKRRFNPNLQRVRMLVNGKPTRAYVCTRCLKGGKVQKLPPRGQSRQQQASA
jgi:large subunit ribosomal protein L28